MNTRLRNSILAVLSPKAQLRKTVQRSATETFESLCFLLGSLIEEYEGIVGETVNLKYERPASNVAIITLDADTLVFAQYTDVFHFDRDHEAWKTVHVKADPSRAYTGIINVYNFTSDSFKYDREEDTGYLIARLFIDKDKNYFVEGKRQRSMGVSHFGEAQIDSLGLRRFVETAIKYAVEFDALVAPYQDVALTDLAHMKYYIQTSRTRSAKRMGFGFNTADVR